MLSSTSLHLTVNSLLGKDSVLEELARIEEWTGGSGFATDDAVISHGRVRKRNGKRGTCLTSMSPRKGNEEASGFEAKKTKKEKRGKECGRGGESRGA